jgi:hypothetical protein
LCANRRWWRTHFSIEAVTLSLCHFVTLSLLNVFFAPCTHHTTLF